MYRAGHYRRWRLSPHWSPPLGVERGPRVPAPHPHVSQTPPPSSPRKPRVGDEQGLLIGGHTHHHSATNLNIPGGCHRPPLAGLIAQHGGRGVLRRQLYADFLVCVVVVLLALYSQLYRLSRQFGECRDNGVATICLFRTTRTPGTLKAEDVGSGCPHHTRTPAEHRRQAPPQAARR